MLRAVSAVLSLILHRADSISLKMTDGRHSIAELVGLPIVQLKTVGAKTQQPHILPLVGLFDREKIVLIGSNFGKKRNPGWYYNLMTQPRCEVIKRGQAFPFMAREVKNCEYQQYWELALTYYAGYEKYKERAAPRRIPILVLEPVK